MSDLLTAGMMLASFALLACRAQWRTGLLAIAAAVIACAAAAFTIGVPPNAFPLINLAAAAITALCVAALLSGVHLGPRQLIATAVVCGGTGGALVSQASAGAVLIVSFAPIAILALGRTLVARGWTIALKVLASWLLAVTILTTASTALVQPPLADHME